MNKIVALTLISTTLLTSCDVNKTAETEALKTDTAIANPEKSNSLKSNPLKSNTEKDIATSYNSINKEQIIEHIKILSSDEFEGRAPSSKGEKLTLDYLTKQFTAIGFKPGNGESFFQAVPLVSIEASPDMTLSIGGTVIEGTDIESTDYQYGKEMVLGTSRISDSEELKNSELVFVGYGINAPEYKWNDYKDLDVKGKTVVILVNDPGFATKDPALFNGNAMTYYGRWTYKFEEASRQGAEGAIIIHETAPASYGWSVVESSWSGPQFGFVREDLNKGRVAVEGWINSDVAKEIFTKAGLDFEQAKAEAAKGSYNVDMGDLTASVSVKNTVKESTSYNFIATLPGSIKPDEHIIYSAHWDHLGKNESLTGDQIYNGAVDNASGIAAIIEVAEAFAKLPVAPERSITIMAVTAEEQGLLGSKFYVANPIIPPAKTVANINIDALGVVGRSKDVSVYGLGQSQLDGYLTTAIQKQGRVISGDPRPAAGIYYRSDHFAFASVGIPALYAKSGKKPIDEATKALREQLNASLAKCYHSVCDEYSDQWDLSGAVEDAQAFFEVGYEISKQGVWPEWSESSEFKR